MARRGGGLFAQRFAASLAGMHDLFVSIIHVYTRFDLSRGSPRLYEALTVELPPLKWSSLKYDFVGGLFDGEEAYG